MSAETDATILEFLKRKRSKRFVPMSFKVDERFHLEYKLAAAQKGITMVDLLKESFALWKSSKRR